MRPTGRSRGPAVLAAGIVSLLWTVGAGAQSQYPLFTQNTFVATMKTVGRNFSGVTQAIGQDDFESAKSRAIRVREQLATTVTFWRRNKKDDAVTLLRAATSRFDELDTLLSRTPVDKDAALEAVKQVGATCQNCHVAFRDQDPVTKAYTIKR